MAKRKFYVVWAGRTPGIYENWSDCLKQVEGFPGARFRGYPSRREAEDAFAGPVPDFFAGNSKSKIETSQEENGMQPPVWKSISVDAACQGNPGLMEYQGVETDTKKLLFRQGPFPNGTNNIGEFLAIVHALAMLRKQRNPMPVYSDSLTARKWVKDKKVKTRLQPMPGNEVIFNMIERALHWLNSHEYPNSVLTWDTASWGEIPADFGRK